MNLPLYPRRMPGHAGFHGQATPAGAYDAVFWLTYLANLLLMMSVSVLFRYADFVKQAGGTAGHLGLIVGVGTVGALAMRIIQGVGIDRFGPRRVWLISLALFVTSMAFHLAITTVHGPGVYLARILMMTSLAGAFGASIAFISLRVPQRRMAEMIGTLGSSGFVGIALGPVLGDWILAGDQVTRVQVQRMFMVAGAISALSFLFAALATAGQIRPVRRRQPPAFRLIRRYHPGILLLVGVAMGWGIGLPHTFLRPYTETLHISGMKTFFVVYSAVAFGMRLGLRRFPERYGVRPMVLAGLGCLILSMLLYLPVRSEWQLLVPAVFAGTAHGILFPSVVAGGCSTFPTRYRGLATTFMMSMFDLGGLFGQPAIGGMVELSRQLGLPGYPTMFLGVAIGLTTVATIYWVSADRPVDMVLQRRRRLQQRPAVVPGPVVVVVPAWSGRQCETDPAGRSGNGASAADDGSRSQPRIRRLASLSPLPGGTTPGDEQ